MKLNLLLQALQVLIGEWKTIGTHSQLPGESFAGYATFERIEGGAFLAWRTKIQDPRFPEGVAIFGSDDARQEIFMLYFDERGVSRKYQVTTDGNKIMWSRYVPGFSQRYTWTVIDGGQTIISKGELSRDGVNWEGDLDQTFTRIN